MRILLDNCTPRPLRRHLAGHQVDTAGERGWERLRNGTLLQIVEEAGYDLLLTTDQSMPFQQNMAGRRISIVAVSENKWLFLLQHVEKITAGLEGLGSG